MQAFMSRVPTFSQIDWSSNMSEAPALTLEGLQEVGAGAFFRPRDAEELGVTYYGLQKLVERGEVEQVARGLYRLTSEELTELYSLAAVCARVPDAVVCLLSALQYHQIGTRLPHEVWIAIPHKARVPRLPEFPVRVVRFSGAAADYGIDEVAFEGVPARITGVARTVVDCFRFHRLVSRETALEALREVLQQGRASPDALWRAAEVLGAKSLIAPSMEALSV
jgi:predicted transcriptional regulator of viral defense system